MTLIHDLIYYKGVPKIKFIYVKIFKIFKGYTHTYKNVYNHAVFASGKINCRNVAVKKKN